MGKFHQLLAALFLLVFFACQNDKPMLQLLPPGDTGVLFSNRIVENDTFNILAFEYVYNGGGVAVGDFNNDSLQDLYFTGNMADNKLYLNNGDMKFVDATDLAGVAAKDHWCSGVTTVDVNADGLLDLYVCATVYKPGSRRKNLLYVNQGAKPATENGQPPAVQFKEMAAEYGIADTSHTTNAAFFDYDNDGDLDLYLLVNEMDKEAYPNRYRPKITDGSSRRTDKLFRNDWNEALGHPLYIDVSKEAGINTEGFGLGVSICDINQDGWKDIYVTNDYLTNDLLWVNNGPSSGTTPLEGGRGVTFSDKAATFFKHTSYSAMGNEVADLNNDGRPDLIAVDMLPEDNFRRKTMLPANNYSSNQNNDHYGYQYQYVRNTFQLNEGSPPLPPLKGGTSPPKGESPPLRGGRGGDAPPALVFSEISMQAGVSGTDWSWSPLAADFDNDGDRDLVITNGFPKDVTNRDFADYHAMAGNLLDRATLSEQIPTVKIHNYAFRNNGEKMPVFEEVSSEWGFTQPSFSNGAAYADLDNDGDLDYVVNNINDSAFVFQNQLVETRPKQANWLNIQFVGSPRNPNGLGAMVALFYENGKMQLWENSPNRGYLSSVEMGAHFGLGSATKVDSLKITWPAEGRVEVLKDISPNQTLQVKLDNAKPAAASPPPPTADPVFVEMTSELGIDFIHRDSDFIDFNVQRLLLHKLSQFGPGIAAGDVNGDGLDDFYVGGSHFFEGSFFVQNKAGQPGFTQQNLFQDKSGKPKVEEELGVLLFDVDNDGDNDLYLVSGGNEFSPDSNVYQDKLYLNVGGQFQLATDALPDFSKSGSCVRAADYDRDGDLDLFVGGRSQPTQYPLPTSSYLLRNDSKNGVVKFALDEAAAPALKDIGLICDALWTDFDNDGWQDLLLAGEWMPLTFLKNEKGRLIPHPSSLIPSNGWWNSLAAADLDLDGDMDYLAGNLGTNTLLKASDERPVAMYAADFDDNKGLDAIPTVWFKDLKGQYVEFPYFGRIDMEKQVIKVKKHYERHATFGQAPMQDLLSKFPTVKPLVLKANYLKTSWVENLGDGKFQLHELPAAAQTAPIYGILTGDFNGDGNPDVLLSGNDFGGEVGMGRYDAMNGLLLTGDGKGNFDPVPMQQSGIFIPGDGKSLAAIAGGDGKMYVAAGQNKGKLKLFRLSENRRAVPLKAMDCAAVFSMKDGRKVRQELHYGQGFLSQSSRNLFLPTGVNEVELIDYQGNKRTVSAAEVE